MASPASGQVLFPRDYGDGETFSFSGGQAGGSYELLVARPDGGGIVDAGEAFLDVTFLSHTQVAVAPRNVTPEVYAGFHNRLTGTGRSELRAGVYDTATDTVVHGPFEIVAVYDPSAQFQNATFVDNQQWTGTGGQAVENARTTFSFPWTAVYAGTKTWGVGNSSGSIVCQIGTTDVATLANLATHDSSLATVVAGETDTTGTSGNVSIEFAAPSYDVDGSNVYTVRIHNYQDPYNIGGEGGSTGCSGSALDVQFTVRRNSAPVFDNEMVAYSMAENTGADRDVGAALTASDADSDTLTYSLEGADAASFAIDSDSGQIKTKSGVSYNYEAKNSYSVTVKADDGFGGTDTIAVTINVTDVNEQPGTPAKPTVMAKAGTTDSLDMRWVRPGLNGGPEITGYDVQYRQGVGGSWTAWSHGGPGVTTTITGLTADTEHQVQVRAKNGELDSEWSDPSDPVRTNAETPMTRPTLSVGNGSGAESDGVTFPVTLSAAATAEVTATWTASIQSGNTAVAADLGSPTTGTVRIPAGQTDAEITVATVDDTTHEEDERFTVTLSNPSSNAEILDATAKGTITDDDAPAGARIRSVTVVNGPGSDGVWRAGERVELEVRYSLPVAVERPGCWDNGDGECRTPGPFVVVVFRADARPGYGEVLSVALVPYAGGSGTDRLRFSYRVGAAEDGARGVVVADGRLFLRGATIRTLEGGDGKPEFTRTRVLQIDVPAPASGAGVWTAGDTVRVKVAFTGPAAAATSNPPNWDKVDVDETGGTPSIGLRLGDALNRPLARTASYEGGSGTNTLRFEYEVRAGDGRVSAVEVVADSLALNGATLRNQRGYDAELHHRGTVPYASLALRVRDAAAAREGGTLRFTMELARASQAPVTVDYETLDGTATAGEDYTAKRGTVTFAPGHTRKTVEVRVLRDEEAEDAETVVLRLSNALSAGSEAPVEVTVAEAGGTIEDVAPEAPSGGLTARFARAPAEHDGKTAFTLRIAFSEAIRMSGRRLRDDVVAVAGGRATKAGRVNQRKDLWELTVKPDSLADVTVTLAGGAACDTPGAVCTADGQALSNTISTVVSGPVAVSVADARVREAPGATLDFAVTLSGPASGPVTVAYRTADGSARAGSDYTARQGKLTFAPGETEQTVRVAVLDDAHDEGEEKMRLVLYRSSGATRADYLGVGTIENADPLPAAWLARFGRTAAGQVMAAVGERLRDGGQTQATVAGQRLDAAAVAEAQAAYERAWAQRLQEGRLQARPRTLAVRDLVAGSSFSVTAAADAGAAQAAAEPGGRWTVWGRGGWSHFAGRADGGDLTLDGDVIAAAAGADYEQGVVLAGLALAYSTGSGSYDHDSDRSGTVKSTLLSVHPYARLALHERLAVWGLFGYGLVGHVTLDDAVAGTMEAGSGMLMGAFGVDGLLLAAAQSGGLELAARADALLLRMSSEAAAGLAASEADLSRWRLLLEASYAGVPLFGGELRPALAVGGRYDAGAAETGAGLVLSGRVSYALPAWGLTLSAGGEGLLVHEDDGFREWGAGGSLHFDPGAPGRGLALSVAPSWGAAASGAGRLWGLPDAASLAPAAAQPSPGARLAAELGYGLDAPGGSGALTPYAGLGLTEAGDRTWRAGARWSLAPTLAMSLDATRLERAGGNAPDHGLAFRATFRW